MSSKEKEDLVKYRFGKAEETINQIDRLMHNKLWGIAVSRLYYSIYYAVSALLADIEVFPKSHAGAAQMFALHYIKTGIIGKESAELYRKLLDMRQKGITKIL